MVAYVEPEDVNSPRQRWTLIAVLDNGKTDRAALCLGRWDGKPVLGMRWNGDSENRVGNPQSRGLATWFILAQKYNEAIISTLPPDKITLVRSFIPPHNV